MAGSTAGTAEFDVDYVLIKASGLPNIVVGVLGAIVGGWIATQLGFERGPGFIAAVVVALIGAIVVRVLLEVISPNDRA